MSLWATKKNSTAYPVDGEIGRFSFDVYSNVDPYGEAHYNTATEFFTPLQGEEKYRTEGFNELALIYGSSQLSYRKATTLLNRYRYQEEGGTPYRTLQKVTEREGSDYQAHLKRKSMEIIENNNFSHEIINKNEAVKFFKPTSSNAEKNESIEIIDNLDIKASLKEKMKENPVPYESTKNVVNISLDDVGVKKQKEVRDKEIQDDISKRDIIVKKRKYIQNTIAHIEYNDKKYMINSFGILHSLQVIIAFLLHNNIHEKQIVFFIDGNSLYLKILRCFYWHKNMLIILDWYHLKKKCKELLSLASKGSKVRNEILDMILPLLWNGLVDEAITKLESVPTENIRNQKEIDHLIGYLKKNSMMIPAYNVRKILGLGNSSGQGEKANDLLVADRQKKNGMSWSKVGSVSLASITALAKNNEYHRWFEHGEIQFEFAA